MGLIQLVVIFVVLGTCWYLITTFIPLPSPIKTVITVIAVLVLCFVLLQLTGIGNYRIGSLH